MQTNSDSTIEIEKIKEVLQADVIVGNDLAGVNVAGIYASDLMSDVLAYGKPRFALITGLNTIQAVISAYMAEFRAVIFLRGKEPSSEIQKFARDKGLVVLSANEDMFEACVKIGQIHKTLGLSDETLISTKKDNNTSTHEFIIDGGDFSDAGMVSTRIKSIVKNIGYDPQLVRRVAICAYEGEMNVVLHAVRAKVTLTASDKEIEVDIDDEGKGIADVKRAMERGYSTATDEQRAMGFGAGMGLPNMKKNSDVLNITSKVGKGTKVKTRFIVE